MAERGSFILAAGGVVVLGSDDGPAVAVVHRTRYLDMEGGVGDWVLPKGKLDPGETLAEAAVREVLEETGCRARIVGPACFVEYEVGGVPKVSAFFPMEMEEEVGVPDSSEVRSVHWLAPETARARLSYDSEQEIVAQILGRSATEA